MVRAVNFNGSNYLINTSMGIQQFPIPYSCGNVPYWFKADELTTGVIIVGFSLGLSEHQVRVMHSLRSNNIITPSIGLQNGDAGSNIVGTMQSGVPYDGQWHNIIWAWNMNGSGSSSWIINATLDGVPVSVGVVQRGPSTSGFSIDYSQTDQWVVGSEAEVGSNYAGCVAELFMYVSNNDYSDITGTHTPSLAYLLLPTGQRAAINLGPQGAAPFNDTPQIYLHGDHTTFPNNHSGATSFTQVPTGSLTDCGDDLFPIRAAYFNGNTYLRNDGTFAGMPDSSPFGLLPFWYNITSSSYGGGVLQAGVASDQITNGDHMLSVFLITGNPATLLTLAGAFNVQTNTNYIVYVHNNDRPLPADGNWHHMLLSWDAPSLIAKCYVDNALVAVYATYDTDGSTCVGYYAGRPALVGAYAQWNNAIGDFLTGSLAELFLLVPTDYIDIDDPSIRAKFIDPDTLLPVEIAADGSTPFGADLLPQIYLSGDADDFPLNLPGNSFSQVFDTRDAAYRFYTPTGSNPLQDASSDPFGPSSAAAAGAVAVSLGRAPLGSFPL